MNDQSDSCGGNKSDGDKEKDIKEMSELKKQLSSQDNMKNGNKTKQLLYEEEDQFCNSLGQTKEQVKDYTSCEGNINTEEIIKSNVQPVQSNINKCEQIIQISNEGNPRENQNLHSGIPQQTLKKDLSEVKSSEIHSVEKVFCLEKNLTFKEDSEYSFILKEPNQLSTSTDYDSTKPFIEDLKTNSHKSLIESLNCCSLSLQGSITKTKPLIEEILSNEDDNKTELTEETFHFKETKLDLQENSQQTCLKNNSNQTYLKNNSSDFIKEFTVEKANFLKSEKKNELQTEISPKKLIKEIFNEECRDLSQDQYLCNNIEEIVDNVEVNKIEEENIKKESYSKVTLKSGQVEVENTSKRCNVKRKTLEHAIFDSTPLKLKKVEAKEDIFIKKTGNSYDLFESSHDQSAINNFPIAASDQVRDSGSTLSQNNDVKPEVAFANPPGFELNLTQKETLSSLSYKLLEETNISSENSAPLNEFQTKSSCVTLADWQWLVYGKTDENRAQFILNSEQTELRSDKNKDENDYVSDNSDTTSSSDTIKRELNRCLGGMFNTNLIKIGNPTEMFSSLPNVAAEITNCNSKENSIISCSLPNICQSVLLENFSNIKKRQLNENYSLFSKLSSAKTKGALEHNVVNSELKPNIDVCEVRNHFSSKIMDADLNKITIREIKNENSVSSAEKDLNYDQFNLVNVENTESVKERVDETNTKPRIGANDSRLGLEDDQASLTEQKSEDEENTLDPQVVRYINRSLELQMASSQSKTNTNNF